MSEDGARKPNGNGHADEFADEEPLPPDPLENLIERAKADVEVLFDPAVIQAALVLRDTMRGRFVALIAEMKQAKLPVGEFRKALDNAASFMVDTGEPENAADTLIQIAAAVPLFLSEDDDESFATIEVNGHQITAPLRERTFRRWLTGRYYKSTRRAPPREALQTAIDTLDARATDSGVRFKVFARVGHADGKVYLDRGTEDWSLIEIDADGWRLVYDAPIRFVRPSAGMGVLPVPVAGASIDDLRRFLNLRDAAGFILAVGWLLGCYQPDGAYTGALLIGPHGSMKTSAMKYLCALVDPLINDPSAPSKDEHDLMIAAQRTHVQTIDNVWRLTEEQATIYCRLSTGGQFRTRKLYTDNEELVLHARRPWLMSSARAVVNREEQVDRTVFLATGEVNEDLEKKRKREEVLAGEFATVWPSLLGVVLGAVSEGLRRKDDPDPDNLPRMASFAGWVTRCERALGWKPGTFLIAYRRNIRDAARIAGELDPVAAAVVNLMVTCGTWKGTATKLLQELRRLAGDGEVASSDWPRSPNWLSHRLEELATLLHRNDITVTFQHSTNRTITLIKRAAPAAGAST